MSEGDDSIKKLTQDIDLDIELGTKNDAKNSKDDEFDKLLDDFIKSELKNIEDEKKSTRALLEEPEPPTIDGQNDDEVLDALQKSEQKLYIAYCNYIDSIAIIAYEKNIPCPTFHIKARTLYPRYTPSLGNLISIDSLLGWDIMFSAFPQDLYKVSPKATDEDLLDFAEAHTDPNLQLAIVSYIEILFQIESCEIEYEKRFLEYEYKRIEKEIVEEHRQRGIKARKYIDAINKKQFPVDAEKLINSYFKVASKDPQGSFEALTKNPAIFAPIEIKKIKAKFFGLIKPGPRDGILWNTKLGQFLKKLKA